MNTDASLGNDPFSSRQGPAGGSELPIGVFDSGVGGLTVLRALRRHLPHERFVYLGDTARLPYGTKSPDSVLRYSLQAALALAEFGIKYLVVACNTASCVAVEALRRRLAPVPVMGVIDPGAAAACTATRSGHVAVLATEGTVRQGAYPRAIARLRPDATVEQVACSLFVALAEEGWTEGRIAEAVAERYLRELFERDRRPDTVLLGCTHFPMLAASLQAVLGPAITLVDSAVTTAAAVAADLRDRKMVAADSPAPPPVLLATDGPERFARVGSRFLDEPVRVEDVRIVDLGHAQPETGARSGPA